jgi:hypothetical protein
MGTVAETGGSSVSETARGNGRAQPTVTHRVARPDDLPLLLRFREECGWGSESLQRNWSDPDRIFCVFMADIDGEVKDVGMGCWYMHQPDDLELACRETGVIHIGKSLR